MTTPDLYSTLKQKADEKLATAAAAEATDTEPADDHTPVDPETQKAARILGAQVIMLLESVKVPSIPSYVSRDGKYMHVGKLWPLYVEGAADDTSTERLISINDDGDIMTGTGESSKRYPRVLQGKEHAASAKAHGAFDVDRLPPAEAIALMESDAFQENVAELVANDRHLTKYIDTIHTEANDREVEERVRSINLPGAIEAAIDHALAPGKTNEDRTGYVTLMLDDETKREAAGADVAQLEAGMRAVITEHLERRRLTDWSVELMTTYQPDGSKAYHVLAVAPEQIRATPDFPPITTVEQHRMLGDLATASCEMDDRVHHDLHHIDDHDELHHQQVVAAMAELRPHIDRAREKAYKAKDDTHTFTVPHLRVIRPTKRNLRTKSEEQTFPVIQAAIAELAHDFPSYRLEAGQAKAGRMHITVIYIGSTPAHH